MEKWVTGEPITASKMNQIGDFIDNTNTTATEALQTANSAYDESTRLKNALTQVTTLTGNPIVITNALAMAPNNITIEITPTQDGVPTPSAPIDINSYSMIALTRTDDTGGNSATRFIDLDFLAGGSVYGGEIVLNEDGTNTLSITWAKKTLAQLNADVRPFQYNTMYSHGVFRTSFTGLKYGNSTIGFCNSYGFYRSEQLKTLGNTMPDKQFGFQSTTSWVVFRDDDYQVANYASEDDMIAAWLADHADTYIVYELKTPIEIPINIMKLSLLDGENILTNDAGLSMTLAYREVRGYTDSTLTKVDTAADAKATGDKITELENKVIKKTDFSNYIGSMSGKIENSIIKQQDSTINTQQYVSFAPFQNATQLIIDKAKSNIFTIGFSTTLPKYNTQLSNVTYHSEATEISVDTPDKTGYVVIQYYNSTTENPETVTQQEVLNSIKVIGINVPTDATLTQQYVAADAKKVGEELADLKSALTKTEIDISRLFIFEQPSITAEMGLLPLHVETGDSITIKRVDGEPFDQHDQIRFYDKNGNYITYWGTPKDWVERTFTYSDQETAEYIGLYLISANSPELCVTNNSSKSLLLAEVNDRKNQDNALNNSIGELRDAITNTNDNIKHIIKGRQPYDLISNYYWMYNGRPGAYNDWTMTGFIPCDPGSTLYIYSPLRSTYNVFFKAATEGDLSDINATFTVNAGLNEIAVPSDAHFFGLSNTTEAMSGTYVKSLVTYEEFVNAEEEVDESSVTALNPRQTVGQRIIQAARRANIWNTTPQPPDPLVLSVLTDLHGSKANLDRFISFTQSYSSYVDDLLSLGDMVATKYSDDYAYWLNTSGADQIMLTIGNHDVWLTGLSGSELASKTDVYAKYFAPKISTWGNGIVQPTNAQADGLMYWYKDYTAKGVRLIVLDCMYWTEAQNEWFVNALSDARTNNLHVIAVQHYNPTKSLAEIDCNFYSLDYGFNNLVQSTGAAQMLADVDAFIAAGGTFVCWLSGDAHYDAFGVYTAQSGNKQLSLTFENAGVSSLWGDANRIVGQKSQDSFNIVSVDVYSKLVKIVRVGNNMDRYMRQKNYICWDYQNHRMIAAE